jgi:hypothetical protein
MFWFVGGSKKKINSNKPNPISRPLWTPSTIASWSHYLITSMSHFVDQFGSVGTAYAQFRPKYPQAVYDTLLSLTENGTTPNI